MIVGMPSLGRRRFLVSSSLTAAGLSLPLANLWSTRAHAREYGELVPDPAGILDLPADFSYTILEQQGEPMDDGYVVPGRPDGMACFEGPGGTWVLMRNHEVSAGDAANGAYGFGESPPESYDDAAFGGVTRVVIDPRTLQRVSSNLVLTGTVRNCAGGPSPWGWLSCEENVSGEHGYVFNCPIDATEVVAPSRIDGYGRFNHEAAAVDPNTLVCYLTEDRGDSAVYRFVPDDMADPFTGTLQALRVVQENGFDTSSGLEVGDTLEVDWVDITDPSPPGDTVRVEAQAAGAALFSRGEGIWFHDGSVFIACTNGGPLGLGQIFRLVDGERGGGLELFAQSTGADELDFPDNVTVAPWGQVFIAEDGGGDNYLRAITDMGDVVSFARNAVSDSELAGVCFSPDGQAMFVNIQADGLTLMITGPFPTEPEDPTGTGTDTGDVASGGLDETGDGDSQGSGADPTDGADGPGDNGQTDGMVTATGDTDGSGQDDSGGGCGCATTDSPTAGLAVAAAAVAVGLHTRRGPTSPDRD